jgi:hypothetical protein
LRRGESGQVGNEAATAIYRKCRRQGSPLHYRIAIAAGFSCRDLEPYMDAAIVQVLNA